MKAAKLTIRCDDAGEARLALMAPQLRSAVFDFIERDLRGWLKYGHTFDDADSALEAARQALVARLPADFWEIE